MRKTASTLLLACLVTFSSTIVAQGIDFFHGTWAEALEKAKAEDRLVFVDAYAKWCGPCKRMAKSVFPQTEVGDFYNANFINLKLDMETPDGRSFGQKYPVSAYPTLLFLDPEGELVLKKTGGQQAEGLINLGKKAVVGWDKSGAYAIRYEAGERDHDLMVNYVSELNKVNKETLKIANDYLNSKPDITEQQKADFLFAAVSESDSRLFADMCKVKSLVLNNVSVEDFKKKVEKSTSLTIAKAVDYDYADLLTEAIMNYKAADVGDLKRFEMEANMEYNLLSGNYTEWKTLSNKYLKKYGKKDSQIYKKQLDALKKEFKHEEDYQTYACEVCKQLVKKEDKSDNYSAYIELLISCKSYAEARKVTNEAIKKAKSRDENISRLERYLKYLDSI